MRLYVGKELGAESSLKSSFCIISFLFPLQELEELNIKNLEQLGSVLLHYHDMEDMAKADSVTKCPYLQYH